MSRIPKILHYTFFAKAPELGGKPWSLVHHVCLRSAIEHINPDKVYLYCNSEPATAWWSLSRDLVTVVKTEPPAEIFGRPLKHVAHQCDVVRLQKLIAHGGIYLDADVLVQRSFDDLLENSVVMGQEGKDGEYGMANAVILAEPNAPFLRRWLEEYRSFRSTGRDQYWSEHSVQLPARLAKTHADEITVLPPEAFFWPLWTEDHLGWIFRPNRPIPPGAYANHLWESNAWKFLEDLTPGQVRRRDTNFHRWAAPYVDGLPDDFGAPAFAARVSKLGGSITKKARRKLSGAKRRVVKVARPLSRALASLRQAHMSQSEVRRQTFQDIYKHGLWGGEADAKFFSGVGSRGSAVQTYVQRMSELLQRHSRMLGRPLTIVDLGCGDFQVGKALLEQLPGFRYVGCDIVPELVAHNNKVHGTADISFNQLDLVSDPLPEGDVCLVRQVFQHLSNSDIIGFFEHANYEWIYMSESHPADRTGPVNPDKRAGYDVRFDWRSGRGRGVELDHPPFGLVTQEMFRALAGHEIIVTERVSRPTAWRPVRTGVPNVQAPELHAAGQA